MFALKCERARFLQDFIVWPKCPQTETARPKCPKTEMAQTESAQTKSRRPNRPDRIGQTESARPKSRVPHISLQRWH